VRHQEYAFSTAEQKSLAIIKVRPRTLWFQQGYSILSTNLNGEIDEEAEQGLYERNTRYLSKYLWQVDGHSLDLVTVQPVAHNSMLGYYRVKNENPAIQNGLDIQIARIIGRGMHEDLLIINHSKETVRFGLGLLFAADFADDMAVLNYQADVLEYERQKMEVTRSADWNETSQELTLHYNVDNKLHHGLIISFKCHGEAHFHEDSIVWDVVIEPHQELSLCADIAPVYCGEKISPLYKCYEFFPVDEARTRMEREWLAKSTQMRCPNSIVQRAYDSAKTDLINMRLWEQDQGPNKWIPAAGLPMYTAVFGRDILTTGWQAGLIGPELMRGAASVLDKYQGTEINDWRDEQPGKMIHEARLGPLSILDKIPHGRYYGSTTSTPLYLIVVSELFHWTGDTQILEEHLPHMNRALDWIDQYGDLDGDGFYEYETRSKQGTKNQGWKDSGDAIIYGDGRQAEPPIATCEEQAWVYEAKVRSAIMFMALKDFKRADQLIHEAHVLKEQFNKAFWMPDENFIALGLDPEKRQINSITSNPGHCLAAGIVDEDKAGPVIGRMLSEDLFSGWGVRTLSNENPSFDPYSYHLGTVWPVENGTFCLAFVRYGFPEHANMLAKAVFETSQHFEFGRLPEALSGHQRDERHPLPSIYPQSNMPQAWSCSAVPMMIQSMLGLYPFAPLNLLLLDPNLPEWLPEVTLSHLRVGNATLSLHFWRDDEGKTHHRILERQGNVKIIPHIFNIHKFHQLKDFSEAYFSHH
jgi:glycogen debranching enzyme